MAAPAPIYPVEHRPGEWRGCITWQIDGITTRIDLHQPQCVRGRRSRCDSFDARDGDRPLIVGGLHAVSRAAISEAIPRSMSRRDIAGMAG